MDAIELIKSNVLIKDICYKEGIEINRSGFISSIYKHENTPSMKIYTDNTFKDYSTGESGSVIDFYMTLYKTDIATAIKELKVLAGIDEGGFIHHPVNTIKQQATQDPASSMSDEEKEVYLERLGITGSSTMALKEIKLSRLNRNSEIFAEFQNYCYGKGWDMDAYSYLTDNRKIDIETLKRFGVFTIKSYYETNNHLKKMFRLQELQQSGLYNMKEDQSGNLIFFQHTIIIPYYFKNRIAYIRGRYFFNGSSKIVQGSMKYLGLRNDGLNLNSPKRFYNWKEMISGEIVYITEGEFDSIALESLGYNAIAIPGVGNIPDKQKFLNLKPLKVVYCGDKDEAGERLLNELGQIFKDMNKVLYLKELPAKDFNEYLQSRKE